MNLRYNHAVGSNLLVAALALTALASPVGMAFPCNTGACRAFDVRNAAERNLRIESLQKDFLSRASGGHIDNCTIVLWEGYGEGFEATGALCAVSRDGKTSNWVMCNDNGVGNFAAVTGARWWVDPGRFVAVFTHDNCVGG